MLLNTRGKQGLRLLTIACLTDLQQGLLPPAEEDQSQECPWDRQQTTAAPQADSSSLQPILCQLLVKHWLFILTILMTNLVNEQFNKVKPNDWKTNRIAVKLYIHLILHPHLQLVLHLLFLHSPKTLWIHLVFSHHCNQLPTEIKENDKCFKIKKHSIIIIIRNITSPLFLPTLQR